MFTNSQKYNFSLQRFNKVAPNEAFIENYCVGQGWQLLPTTRMNQGKDCAPVMASNQCQVLPDFLVMSPQRTFWLEVKCADTAPMNRKHGCRVLGIKRNNYFDYMSVAQTTGFDVLLVWFLANKWILTAQLKDLPQPWDCQCGCCREGNFDECWAENLVYWDIKNLHRNRVLESAWSETQSVAMSALVVR
jgi:hypothetical protein